MQSYDKTQTFSELMPTDCQLYKCFSVYSLLLRWDRVAGVGWGWIDPFCNKQGWMEWDISLPPRWLDSDNLVTYLVTLWAGLVHTNTVVSFPPPLLEA